MERKMDGRAKRGAARRRSFQPQANKIFSFWEGGCGLQIRKVKNSCKIHVENDTPVVGCLCL